MEVPIKKCKEKGQLISISYFKIKINWLEPNLGTNAREHKSDTHDFDCPKCEELSPTLEVCPGFA